MQFNQSTKRRGQILFIVVLFTSLVFIGFSIFMIIRANKLQREVSKNVQRVEKLSTIEQSSFKILNNLHALPDDTIREKIKSLKTEYKNTFSSAYPKLKKKVESLIVTSDEITKTRKSLTEIYSICKQLIKKQRRSLSKSSAILSTYWDYTHILIVAACVMSIISTLLGYYIYKAQSELAGVKLEKDLLFNNSIDCVITSNNKGRIESMNLRAKETFGYEESEIKNEGLHILYEDNDDYIRVLKTLEKDGEFQGEVLNKSKSGALFTSFLSANLLYDEKGVIKGAMGVSRDISSEKEMNNSFGAIINSVTDVIYQVDVEGKFIFVNEASLSIMGYKQDEMIDESFEKFVHSDDLEKVRSFYRKQFKTKETSTVLEFRVIKKDKTVIWVRQNVKAIFDRSRTNWLKGFYGILSDITKRKEAEQELAENEEKYKDLVDNTEVMIQTLDQEGNLTYVNNAWVNKLGYSLEEAYKMNLFEIIDHESQDHCKNLFQEITKNGYCETNPIYQLVSKSGQIITVKGSVQVKHKKGQIINIHSFLHDITKEKNAEDLLVESEANFRQITETLNDVVFLYNIFEKRYEYISPNCKEVMGASQNFIYEGGNHAHSFVHSDDIANVEHAKVLVESGKEYDIEYRIIIDNEEHWINEKSFPIYNNDGKVVRNSGVCRDITSSKKVSEKLRDNSLKINRSIEYAKNIQKAALPSDKEVKDVIPESFIFHTPKSALSGDFYMVDQVKTNDKRVMPLFLVADCTGHGIPGAILSLLCNALIKETFSNSTINSPAEALDYVRKKIISLFKRTEHRTIYDGMDLAFCVLDYKRKKLYFSGAQSPCVIIRNGEILEYKGDRLHIGYSKKEQGFSHQEIDVQKGDCIYLFSDGFVDQFGGANDKKMLKKRFYKLLKNTSMQSMQDQHDTLKEKFYEWKGERDQTDDVTLLGVRV